ncbi:MAG TPA: RIP metalloprotease RseP [Leptolyngbyaceae cyanobacterium M33_DOE_097]|uniref:Zinc metalloprotease n=1 Tax=Oscillatoriales cyanobacterium SpSt-418 TaxID=2282169 RepID=A0A7C3KF30_9CYAN|nr:RIP metalloprotease RseP [Leptolyngbyaceae cyanobacterium M33_DOE_097]
MSVLAAIAVLALLIVVHELGHFSAARLQGIYANRFSIGFGPTLLKYQGKNTEYALRAFPLGGFVGFPDDDPEAYGLDPRDPNLLKNRPVMDRVIVISAGVIANLLFAYLLLVTQVGISGIQEFKPAPGVLVPAVKTELSSAAAKAGIQANDVILAVNGKSLGADREAIQTLMSEIQNNPSQALKVEIQRDGQKLAQPLTVTPILGEDGKGKIGVQLSPNGTIDRRRITNPIEILTTAATEFQRITVLTVQGFGQLLTNFGQMADQVAGPVKIVAEGAKLANSDATNLITFGALISINLAIINILPLPALDGGHLAFLLIEALRGKPVPNQIQEGVMQTGLMLLLGLGIFLIIRDTANLIPQ